MFNSDHFFGGAAYLLVTQTLHFCDRAFCFIKSDRMPVVLPGEDVNLWIRPDPDPKTFLKHAITELTIENAGWDSK